MMSRRIFDMARDTWKQMKTLLVMPVEVPSSLLEMVRTDIDAAIRRQMDELTIAAIQHGSAPATQPPPASAHDFDAQARQLVGPPARVDGHYLCEFCFDAMTDKVLPAAVSPTGLAMGWCGCLREPAQ